MSALSGDFNAPALGAMGIPVRASYPVLADAVIYAGAGVVITAAGYAKPAVSGTALVSVGRAILGKDATGLASGALTVEVNQGAFEYDVNGTAVTIADIGTLCYWYDDHTITKDSTSRSIAGTIYAIGDATGKAYVYLGLAPAVDGTSLTALSNTVSTFKSNLVTTVCVPVPNLSSVANAGIVARYVPHMAGSLLAIDAQVTTAAVTSGKTITLTPIISDSTVTGGVLVIASTTAATLVIGKRISATAITAANTFTATQEITISAGTVTAFVEGAVLLELFLQSN